ncbi:MAG: CAP domain-containing protein [Alysiella sp.]|uniref:CAP domain-containing protein n=1 Tax=Alysiella sp. TaxID=1872483 RepID=UPI0026DBD89B|nr:CAP domain-containing protein [Alysiella sp.]MDO4434532.1 CAP domain-containing protein [Alysiella sp.]
MKTKISLAILLWLNATAQANETEWLNAINQIRAEGRKCGKINYPPAQPLSSNRLLQQVAQNHANEMAKDNFFSHNGQNGSTPFSRIKKTGYTYLMASENIAAGDENFEKTLMRWLTSEGHCANIMDDNATETGIAYAYSSDSRYQHYWVQVFALPR